MFSIQAITDMQTWTPKGVAAVVLSSILLILTLKKFRLILQRKVLSLLWGRLSKTYHETVRHLKKAHFASMADHKSADPELRKKGVIRILEIGAGPGWNFEFYPPGSQLTVVEPNTFFKPQFYGNQNKYPDVKFERFVVGNAEDMAEVESNSIDIVVQTLVFCSVSNIEKSLKEIRRVLAPGGKFYYWEHVHDHHYSLTYFWQLFCTYTYHWLLFSCWLNRKTDFIMEKYKGFSKVEQERFYAPMKGVWVCIRPHVKGIATK